MLGKERTSSIPVCLVMNVSGYGIDLHVGNRVIDMEDFLTTVGSLVRHAERESTLILTLVEIDEFRRCVVKNHKAPTLWLLPHKVPIR